MNNPETLVWIGGAVIVLNAATQIAVNIISEVILGKNGKKHNGFCSEHYALKDTLEQINESHKEEKQEEMLTNALCKALERNGKK